MRPPDVVSSGRCHLFPDKGAPLSTFSVPTPQWKRPTAANLVNLGNGRLVEYQVRRFCFHSIASCLAILVQRRQRNHWTLSRRDSGGSQNGHGIVEFLVPSNPWRRSDSRFVNSDTVLVIHHCRRPCACRCHPYPIGITGGVVEESRPRLLFNVVRVALDALALLRSFAFE
jgi:hypothetical protein